MIVMIGVPTKKRITMDIRMLMGVLIHFLTKTVTMEKMMMVMEKSIVRTIQIVILVKKTLTETE